MPPARPRRSPPAAVTGLRPGGGCIINKRITTVFAEQPLALRGSAKHRTIFIASLAKMVHSGDSKLFIGSSQEIEQRDTDIPQGEETHTITYPN